MSVTIKTLSDWRALLGIAVLIASVAFGVGVFVGDDSEAEILLWGNENGCGLNFTQVNVNGTWPGEGDPPIVCRAVD